MNLDIDGHLVNHPSIHFDTMLALAITAELEGLVMHMRDHGWT